MRTFAQRCAVLDLDHGNEAIREAFAAFAARFGLTAGELEVVHAGLHGRRAEWLQRERGLDVPAYRARVRSILDRTGADDLSAVCMTILLWARVARPDELRI